MRTLRNKTIGLWLAIALIIGTFLGPIMTGISSAQSIPQYPTGSSSRNFPETGHTVSGPFLTYWESHGGLEQQGYPISDLFTETSTTDGKTYWVQYFQRARFEWHPEYSGTKYEVLLGLLGVDAYNGKYGILPPGNGNVNYGLVLGSEQFCKALSTSIGGPVYKWWGTQTAVGQELNNSCVLREADDRDPLGWELFIPAGVTGHLWVYNSALNVPAKHIAVTVNGPGVVKNGWLVSRATLYFKTGVDHGQPGKWTVGQLSWNDTAPCGWSAIGQMPQICDKIDPTTGFPLAGQGNSGNSGNGGNGCTTLSQVKGAVKGNLVEENPNYLVYDLTEMYTLPKGIVANFGSNDVVPSGTQVGPGRVTFYMDPNCR